MTETDEWYSRANVGWSDDGQWEFRASSFGSCPHALAFDMTNVFRDEDAKRVPSAPDKWLQGAMDESAALEQQAIDLWADTAVADGHDVWVDEPDDLTVELDADEYRVVGTVDGYVRLDGEDAVLEIKVVGEQLFEQLSQTSLHAYDKLENPLVRKYRMQCSVYAEATCKDVVLAVCEKRNGALTGRVTWRRWGQGNVGLATLQQMEEQYKAVCTEAIEIRLGELACGQADVRCPWSEWCVEVVPLPLNLEQKLQDYRRAKRDADEMTAIASLCKEEISEWVREHGGKAVAKDGAKVTWVEQHVPEKVVKAHDRKYLRVGKPKEEQ